MEIMDYFQWCERVLSEYLEAARNSLAVRSEGLRPDQDARRIFGPAGSNTYKLALNTDYLPTFADLACSLSSPCDTQNWRYVPDGRSLLPVLKGNATNWRNAVLLEGHQGALETRGASLRWHPDCGSPRGAEVPGARNRRKRTVLPGVRPPRELNNRYPATTPSAGLVTRLHALKTCAADSCRAAEYGQ